jgi:membrane protein implicated in regulation of membrane protease activity
MGGDEMFNITMKEFAMYLALFGTQAAIWIPLMNLFEGNLMLTLVVWFVISVTLARFLKKRMKL